MALDAFLCAGFYMIRFITRELDLATMVVAISLGWCVDRSRLIRQAEVQEDELYSWKNRAGAAKNELEKRNWVVTWEDHGARFENNELRYISSHNW